MLDKVLMNRISTKAFCYVGCLINVLIIKYLNMIHRYDFRFLNYLAFLINYSRTKAINLPFSDH